jgi:splicing factor 3B subunit 3
MYVCECDVQADKDSTGEAAQEVEKKLTYYELDLGLNHVVG